MDYKEIENVVEQYLVARGIAFSAGYVGQKKDGSGWEHFWWRAHLSRKSTKHLENGKWVTQGRDANLSTDYRMGLAHVTKSKSKYSPDRPKPPIAASVIRSLLGDMRFGEMSFHEFCNEGNFNYDSIKDLNIYRECEKMTQEIRNFFTGDEIQNLEALLQDY